MELIGVADKKSLVTSNFICMCKLHASVKMQKYGEVAYDNFLISHYATDGLSLELGKQLQQIWDDKITYTDWCSVAGICKFAVLT